MKKDEPTIPQAHKFSIQEVFDENSELTIEQFHLFEPEAQKAVLENRAKILRCLPIIEGMVKAVPRRWAMVPGKQLKKHIVSDQNLKKAIAKKWRRTVENDVLTGFALEDWVRSSSIVSPTTWGEPATKRLLRWAIAYLKRGKKNFKEDAIELSEITDLALRSPNLSPNDKKVLDTLQGFFKRYDQSRGRWNKCGSLVVYFRELYANPSGDWKVPSFVRNQPDGSLISFNSRISISEDDSRLLGDVTSGFG